MVPFIWILFGAQNAVGSKVFVLRLVSIVIAVEKLLRLSADDRFPVLYKDFDDRVLVKWPFHNLDSRIVRLFWLIETRGDYCI